MYVIAKKIPPAQMQRHEIYVAQNRLYICDISLRYNYQCWI
jgi:hypothetical protein